MVVLTESEMKRVKQDHWIKNYGIIGLVLLVMFGMFYLPYRAGKNMFRGHVRNPVEIVFKTILMNLILIAAGWWIALVLFVGSVPDPADGEITLQEAQTRKDIGRASARNVTLVFFGIGSVIGLLHRPEFYRNLHNERFLAEQGFILVKDDREYPYQDGEGYNVKLLDPNKGKIVVLYRYQSNYRGAIELDSAGKMKSYSGAVDLRTNERAVPKRRSSLSEQSY